VTTAAPSRIAIPLDLERCAVPANAQLQELTGSTMGTTWSVTFCGSRASAQTLQRAICSALDLVVTQMSPWDPDSALSQFNRRAPGEWQALPVEFCSVIEAALRIADQSDGAYDPTMGLLIDLWGFGPAGPPRSLPSSQDIAHQRDRCGWRKLEFDKTGRRLRRHGGGRLDLNGIAKGFAVDLLMTILRRHDLHHALVEIGGELAGAGVKPDGTPWWVAVARPAADPAPSLLVALHGLAIATSGCERSYTCAGRSVSHTIDSRTGSPIDNGMVAATVLHTSCMEADAYATALMVMGARAGMAFAERHDIAATMLFTTDAGAVAEQISPALQAMLS
jgi:FAD:protein FMN transferase